MWAWISNIHRICVTDMEHLCNYLWTLYVDLVIGIFTVRICWGSLMLDCKEMYSGTTQWLKVRYFSANTCGWSWDNERAIGFKGLGLDPLCVAYQTGFWQARWKAQEPRRQKLWMNRKLLSPSPRKLLLGSCSDWYPGSAETSVEIKPAWSIITGW